MTFADGSKANESLSGLFPGGAQGWKPEGSGQVYDATTLYEYINGGAEVYRSFNVQQVMARRYVKADGVDILVDIFDMGCSSDAYGAYHHDVREGPGGGVGQESEYLDSSLSFWKDRFFVSIIALGEGEESNRAVLELGRAIAGAIPREGDPPAIVGLLPEQGRLPHRTHYFHDHQVLGKHCDPGQTNLLGLGRETEGVVARYRAGGKEGQPPDAGAMALVLIRYPSRQGAEDAGRRFMAQAVPDADVEGIGRGADAQWVGAKTVNDFLVAVLESPSKEEIQRLFREVKQRIVELSQKQGGQSK